MKEKTIDKYRYDIQGLIRYWDAQQELTSREKMEGLVHSLACMVDGVGTPFQPLTISLRGVALNENIMLHDQLHKK